MKRILTLLFIGTFFVGFTQLPVSQTVENKKVVLEEFTGKTCVYCPDGHKIANTMKEADPDNVFLINIHTGGYAAGTPNYRTDYGTALANQSGNNGSYPSGTINRYVFSGSTTALNRSLWIARGNTIKSQSALVNVACEAEIDVVTNILTVNVQAYYTGTQTATSNFLNVALTQDDIWGPQTGASDFYPENVDPVTGLYKHGHMLRELLTGQWGDEITTVSQGTLVSRTYTYTLPAQIGDVPVDISKLHIVSFMTETRQNIMNAGGTTPTLVNFPNNLEAEMISLSAPSISCDGIVVPEFNVRNFGQQDITSLDIKYSVNSGTEYTYSWTGGPILPGYNLDITMPQVGFAVMPTNQLDINIDKVNGATDDVTNNNSASVMINGVDEHITDSVVIEVTPDAYAAEIGWELLDASGAIVDSVATGTWTDGDQTMKTATVPLSALDCYTLNIFDTYGDGLLGAGKVDMKDGNGNVLHTVTGSYSTSVYKFATNDAAGNGNGNGDGSSVNPTVNPTGIRDINNAFTFGIYPNPANDILFVNFEEEVSSIEVVNILGEVVISTDLKQIDVAALTSGVYFVTLTDTNGASVSQSFVKK